MDRIYAIEAAAVVSDVIDGEAVMLHRVSGDYFSTDGIGCLIWQWIGEGRSRSRILGLLNERFAVSPMEVATAVDSFLVDLVTHSLVREAGECAEPDSEPSMEQQRRPEEPFTPPVLNVYSDIRKLLLLDPIHDVEEQTGWPAPKRTDAPA